jgi:dTDP-4-dehydrorhamnose 3,5-epimerase
MIQGVAIRWLEPHVDARGSLTELLRSDWPEVTRFGQAILTVNLPGVIRAWHWHREQTDAIVVVSGRALLPVYDGRPGSPTFGRLNEYIGDGERPFVIFVPPGVRHGYKTLGSDPALILNFPDRVYDPAKPDEERVAFDTPEIAFDWDRARL